ncbi:hypothetical protein [Methylobacterium indicum]|uniref:hypothetical protein n=1 Tax=Methylobacterium indicum TaxID=1775910 RepID=UPI0024360C64|nr:hypothetical protein [Methylobacterium indicum]
MMVTDHPVGFLATMTVIIGNPITPFTSLPAMPAQPSRVSVTSGKIRHKLRSPRSRRDWKGVSPAKTITFSPPASRFRKKIVPHNALWCLNRDFTIFND